MFELLIVDHDTGNDEFVFFHFKPDTQACEQSEDMYANVNEVLVNGWTPISFQHKGEFTDIYTFRRSYQK